MILSGSRYQGVPFTGITSTDGTTKKFLHNRRVYSREDVGQNYVEHTVEGAELMDALAERYYGRDDLWWLIADVNDRFFMFEVQPGELLIIPDISILSEAQA